MSFRKFKTERILLASVAVLFLFLFASAFTRELVGTSVSSAEETSSASVENEGSGTGDDSDSEGEQTQEEESQDNETSEPSTASTPSVRTMQRTGVNTGELSEKSIETEVSEQSVETEEVSEVSEPSQEISEESIKFVEGYGEVVSKEGNVAMVKQDEKLFFLIPVEVESQVTLDEQGTVVDAKKTFLNWLLSVLSF